MLAGNAGCELPDPVVLGTATEKPDTLGDGLLPMGIGVVGTETPETLEEGLLLCGCCVCTAETPETLDGGILFTGCEVFVVIVAAKAPKQRR